jgi:hypothetical protein
MVHSKFTFKLIILTVVLQLISISAYVQDSIPGDFCISEDEVKLFDLVNNYRKSVGLIEIPLSKSLCYVAKKHAADLYLNKPDTANCNFHSWSNKGNWTPCCFEKEIKDKSCMLDKPQELTKYPGQAYEIIYWENKSATAEKAFNQWKETPAARSLLSNYKEWEKYSWNAIGVGIYKGFAIAWFGEDFDIEKETKICGRAETIVNTPTTLSSENQVISAPTGYFYIIVGNFASLSEAKEKLKDFHKQGFKMAKVVVKDNKFRISISDYSNQELAAKAKRELPAKYKDAWILPY